MIYVVDTHALVWYLEDSPRLGLAARSAFQAPESRFAVPVIVLAEAKWLARSRRTGLRWEDVLPALEVDTRFGVLPLTLDVLRHLPDDQKLEMHDAIICATAFVIGERTGDEVTVITRDRQIRDSGLVQTVW